MTVENTTNTYHIFTYSFIISDTYIFLTFKISYIVRDTFESLTLCVRVCHFPLCLVVKTHRMEGAMWALKASIFGGVHALCYT